MSDSLRSGARETVLLTGSEGALGTPPRPATAEQGYAVRGLDLRGRVGPGASTWWLTCWTWTRCAQPWRA